MSGDENIIVVMMYRMKRTGQDLDTGAKPEHAMLPDMGSIITTKQSTHVYILSS